MTPFLAPQLNRELLQLRLDATQPRSADTKEKASQPLDEIRNLLNQQGDRLIADCHWAGWYDVLDKYFSQPPQAPGTNSYILSSSHYAAWAVMALMWIGPYSHPAAWIMCWVIVTVSLLQESLSVLGQKLESARPSRQTAIMLQHLHAKQEAERLRGIGQRGGSPLRGHRREWLTAHPGRSPDIPRQPVGSAERQPQRPVQLSDQRSISNPLQMERERTDRCRNRRLPLKRNWHRFTRAESCSKT